MIIYIKNYFRLLRQLILRILVRTQGYKFSTTNKKTLIIAPHPDDETFGCAGLILKKIAKNADVNILFLTDGENSLATISTKETRKERIKTAKEVAALFGVEGIYSLGLTDGKIPRRGSDDYIETVRKLDGLIKEIAPKEVFVTHPLDSWSDHTGASELSFDVLKNNNENIKLFYYWVWVWYSLPFKSIKYLHFKNTEFLTIKDVFKIKKQAIQIYLDNIAKNNQPYIGELPIALLNAFNWPYEVFEKVPLNEV